MCSTININDIIKCAVRHGNRLKDFDGTATEYGVPHYHRITGQLGCRAGKCYHISDNVPGTYWIIGSDYPIFDSRTREFLHEYNH